MHPNCPWFYGFLWVGTCLTGIYKAIDVETLRGFHCKTFSTIIFHLVPDTFDDSIMILLRYKILSVDLSYIHLYVQVSDVCQIPHHPTIEANLKSLM